MPADLTRAQEAAADAMALHYGRSSCTPLDTGDLVVSGLDDHGNPLWTITVDPAGRTRLANVNVDAVYAIQRGVQSTEERLHEIHTDWSGGDDDNDDE